MIPIKSTIKVIKGETSPYSAPELSRTQYYYLFIHD